MTAEQLSDKEIFAVARGLDSAEAVTEYLDQVCGSDRDLRDRVKRLLDADRTDGFLQQRPLADTVNTAAPVEHEGHCIGKYKLLEEIGDGGMGVVFMAEQLKPIARRVALKIIKPGLDTNDVIARFEAERQALSMMDHPNIAKVLDAGATDSGRPYFVMELVRGLPITKYCDQHQFSVRERLELFVPVCLAVQHAHQKGIIHRDLKPSNVLVAQYDDRAVPKIIDFGVAKAISQRLTDRTLFTRFGQIVGTFAYMSPEQAKFNNWDVDTRTDVYSLGVVLYELLTGETPLGQFRSKHAEFEETLRIIRQEEPSRPSVRLISGASFKAVEDDGHAERKRLAAMLRGELDWIVMKSLEKDRSRRYESASAMALDIQRFLNNESVEACPPSTSYRLRKALRRHKTLVASAASVLLALAIGVFGTVWFAIESKRNASLANQRAKEEHEQRVRAEQAEDLADRRYQSEKIARREAELQRKTAELRKQRVRELLYVASMKQASDALSERDVPRVINLLQLQQPSTDERDLRDFAWHYLNISVHAPRIRTNDLQGRVVKVTVSPDRRRVACATRAGTLNLYDSATGHLVDSIAMEPDVTAVAWAPDGQRIASAHYSGLISVWDVNPQAEPKPVVERNREDGSNVDQHRRLLSFRPYNDGVMTLAFTSDGQQIFCAGTDHQIRVFDAVDGRPITNLAGHKRTVEEIAVSPDGTKVASASSDQTVRWWDVQSKTELRRWAMQTRARVVTVDLSPDGTTLVAGDIDGNLLVAEPHTKRVAQARHRDGIESVIFLADGKTIAAGDRAGSIQLWNIQTSSKGDLELSSRDCLQWQAHQGRVETLALAPDTGWIMSGGRDGLFAVWSPTLVKTKTYGFADIAVAADGSVLKVQSEIKRFDQSGERLLSSLAPLQRGWIHLEAAAAAPIVAAASDDLLAVFDLESGSELARWSVGCEIDQIAIATDGRTVAIRSGTTDRVIAYDVSSQQTLLNLSVEQCSCLAFSPDGTLLAVGSLDDLILYRVDGGQESGRLVGHDSTVSDVRFHPDGRTAFTVGDDRHLKVWDMDSAIETLSAQASDQPAIDCIEMSHDGRILATAGYDEIVRIWHVGTLQTLLKIDVGQQVKKLRFTADDRKLIVQYDTRIGETVTYDATGAGETSNKASD